MPVWGGKRSGVRRPALNRKLGTRMEERAVRGPQTGAKHLFTKARGAKFKSSNTTLAQLRKYHHTYVGRDFNLVEEARKQFTTYGKPTVVLEWGTGNTRALSELARETRGMTRCIGYGRDSYRTWKSNRLVETIQRPHEQLPRFFKEKSVGIIFSHHGLQHLLATIGMEKFSTYVGELATKLKEGGVFVSYPIRKLTDPALERELRDRITKALRGKGTFDIKVASNTLLIRRAQ